MPRIPRIHRVLATYRNGDEAEWHYQQPEDALSRADKLQRGRFPALNAAERKRYRDAGEQPPLDVPVSVKVESSHPITWPHVTGDSAPLDVPGATLSADWWSEVVLDSLGVTPGRVLSLTWHRGERIVLELENGKHAPTHWSIELTD